ncbi:DUF4398 domain-containing protein [Halorarius litoreus]|uniref:DUF4398 domain-containing protein n=1 Tax=Halorarius litoreus TaxID=2962676 RepID=UPI0020CDCE34|nr:DUF4398 domain-containing protein [Halorarius litoreus]
MSWSRCSKALVVSLLLLTAAVVPAAAVSTSKDGVPDETAEGSEVTATYRFTELYSEFETWTLNGRTELSDVTWTVRKLDQAGNQINQTSYDGASFNESVDIGQDTAEIVVRVRGTAPTVENFTYDPAEQFTFARFQLRRQGGSNQQITADETHHFTEESKEARDEIESAQQAIDAAGGNQQAEQTLANAISAYNAGNFGNAVDLANQAEQRANQAQSSQNTTQLLLYGGIGLVVLLLVIGGLAYYRSQQDTYDKLR